MKPLVCIRFETAVTGRFAARMVEVIEGTAGNKMHLFSSAVQVTRPAETRVDKREGYPPKLCLAVTCAPGTFKLKVYFGAIEHEGGDDLDVPTFLRKGKG